MSFLGKLLANTPGGVDRLRTMGHSFARGGRPKLAQWALSQVVTFGEPDATLLFKLGQLQSEELEFEAALDSLRAGLEISPNFYLCRRLLFETCRALYWSESGPGKRSQRHPLSSAHDIARPALPPFLRREIGRLAEEDIFSPMFERLESRGEPLPEALTLCRDGLRRAFDAMEERSTAEAKRAVYQVTTRDKAQIQLSSLRDADDLIGYHLEVILDDGLFFIPMEDLRSLTLGPQSDYFAAQLRLVGGEELEVILPRTYFGSKEANLEDLRLGEVSVLQSLFEGCQVGLGRRILMGKSLEDGQDCSIHIGQIASMIRLDVTPDAPIEVDAESQLGKDPNQSRLGTMGTE